MSDGNDNTIHTIDLSNSPRGTIAPADQETFRLALYLITGVREWDGLRDDELDAFGVPYSKAKIDRISPYGRYDEDALKIAVSDFVVSYVGRALIP